MEPITEISDAERIDCFQEYTYPDWFVDATSILTKIKEKLGEDELSFEYFPENNVLTVMLLDSFKTKKGEDNFEATIIEMNSNFREKFVEMCKRVWKNYSGKKWSEDFYFVICMILMEYTKEEPK